MISYNIIAGDTLTKVFLRIPGGLFCPFPNFLLKIMICFKYKSYSL